MADLATNTRAPLRNPIAGFFNAIGELLMSVAENNTKARQMQTLMDMTDEQLAKRGLKRSEIAQFVFRETYWM